MHDRQADGARALRGYSVVDGGDIVGIMQRGGGMVRIPRPRGAAGAQRSYRANIAPLYSA